MRRQPSPRTSSLDASILRCAAIIALAVLPSPARAGMCGSPAVRVYPSSVKTVPANLQLRVRVRDVEPGMGAVAKADHTAFSLVPEHGDALALHATREPDATHAAGGTLAWLTLTADQPLVVGEKYALARDREKLSWLDPYTAGPALDAAAPTFTVRSARFVTTRPTGNTKGSVYGDHIVVTIGETSLPRAQLVFMVTPLDLAPAAPIWREVDGDTFAFGAIGECAYRDLALAGHGRQRFELRGVDLTGHASLPVAITVDTGAVKRARPASNSPHR